MHAAREHSHPSPAGRTSNVGGLGLTLALSLTVLGIFVYGVAGELAWDIGRSKILHSIGEPGQWGRVLPWQVATYAAAILGLHVALAVATWLLAVASDFNRSDTPRQRHARVVVWFLAILMWILAANQAWFPASDFSSARWNWIDRPWAFGVSAFGLYSIAVLVAITATLSAALWRAARNVSVDHLKGPSAVFAASVLLVAILGATREQPHSAPSSQDRPNVILIGIDSLRCDTQSLSDQGSLTPHVDAFLAHSHLFSDATTPLARTFGAWVSILTGQHPSTTNARFNLMPRNLVNTENSLGSLLRDEGYRTVYATDEVRFANIDESYGFDQLITPTIGASDFMLAKVNDQPLTNLLSSTDVGRALFPNTYTNRAAYATYEPGEFIRRIDRELAADGPVFLVAHLTLAHYPYSWAGHGKPSTHPEYRAGYKQALAAVDQQFHDLMKALSEKGLLENAYVVLLSDHGEALGFQNDSYLRQFDDADMLWNSLWGHGTSVLSPHQFQVVLAYGGFGRASLPSPPAIHDVPATLEDINPTLLDLLGLDPPATPDGISLASVMRGEQVADRLLERIRFTETGFNTPKVLKGQYDERGLLEEGAVYYELVPSRGWLQLKPDRIPELMEQKERAAVGPSLVLAALPDPSREATRYILAPRRGGLAMRVESPPDPHGHPEAARLWAALHERFAGEI